MGTGLEYLALAAITGFGAYQQDKAQKEAAKQQEKLAKKESSKPPQAATEQKKVDTAAKARSALQSNLYAGAKRGSTATGGTTLG